MNRQGSENTLPDTTMMGPSSEPSHQPRAVVTDVSMCVHQLVHKRPTPEPDIVSREAVPVGTGGTWEFSVPSAQFCCEPESAIRQSGL